MSCVSGMCTHRPVLFSKSIRNGNEIQCHSHGAVFNIETGRVISAPATKSLHCYPIQINQTGEILIDIETSQDTRPSTCSKCDCVDKVVIVGSGASAVACGEELIENGFKGKVEIITEDTYEPYDRTLISKRFAHVPYTDLLKMENVDYLSGTSIININTNNKQIRVKQLKNEKSRHLQCGPQKSWQLATVSYDKLVLATGHVIYSLHYSLD